MLIAESIEDVRHYLHRHPELSGEEADTSHFLRKYIQKHFPEYRIKNAKGSYGFIATKKFGDGPHVAFRAELDGLPIKEESTIPYKSEMEGKSHTCGHDGHMSILLATFQKLEEENMDRGTASFLFQPAEETGKGAEQMLHDIALSNFQPDALVALHNIPGEPMGLVLSKPDTFACGSVGFRLHIEGKTAHAAHPEGAVNPLLFSKSILDEVLCLPGKTKGFSLATPIALHSGLDSFGVSPADATLLVTLRAALSEDLEWLMSEVERMTQAIKEIHGIKAHLNFEEYFPSTPNKHFHSDFEEICSKLNRSFELMEEPFRWSEDFGHYSKRFKTHMFGLGSGLDRAPLHASTFDFPNELIDSGAEIFVEFYKHYLAK
jgi:amidohydrolase